jgi:hypothetical protein
MTSAKTPAIVVVSGLPRSGTSMAMRMLEAGGLPIVTDRLRVADEDNLRGYFEFEPVKHLHAGGDAGWLASSRGKAVKIISFLLTWLPESYDYRVIFMRRDLGEVVASQEAMLARRGEGDPMEPGQSPARTVALYEAHLAQVDRFLARRPCFATIDVDYRQVLVNPRVSAERMATFLGSSLDVAAMATAVDPTLHHQRRAVTPS